MVISIIVITYNSNRYVLETLESAYRQTYADIELIVSDDCSTDNTFTLCQEWVEAHKDRFVRTLCTQTPHNGGICRNYNHALQHAQGEWIKYIAGDDILLDNCIEGYVRAIKPDIYFYASAHVRYEVDKNEKYVITSPLPNSEKGVRNQVRYTLVGIHAVHGSALFFERNHLVMLGGFDTRYKMSEDYPISMKYLTHGYCIETIDEPLVIWRSHSKSVSHASWDDPNDFHNEVQRAVRYYRLHYCWRYGMFLQQYHYFVKYWIDDHYQKNKFYTMMGYILKAFDFVHTKQMIFSKFK